MMNKAHYLYHWTSHFLTDRVEQLKDRDDRGQVFAEYIGVILVIAAILGVLAVTDIGDAIVAGIKQAIKDVTEAPVGE